MITTTTSTPEAISSIIEPEAVAYLATTFKGQIVECGGIVYLLTVCCRASATGTEGGTACRACYRMLDDMAGYAFLTDSPTAQQEAETLVRYVLPGANEPDTRRVAEGLLSAARRP